MPRPLAEREVSQVPAAAPPSSPDDKLERILHNLVWRAVEDTDASSAAIGVMNEDAMICRAVAGLPFAQVGAPIDTESGLTAMAVSREMSQWCSDTESDERVDAQVCRKLGVRSIIVVPVHSGQSVAGVFAIFSTAPDAFNLESLNTLKNMAHWAGEAIDAAKTGSSQTAVAAKPEYLETHPPISLYSEVSSGLKIRKYLAKIWRALAPASPKRQNERTG